MPSDTNSSDIVFVCLYAAFHWTPQTPSHGAAVFGSKHQLAGKHKQLKTESVKMTWNTQRTPQQKHTESLG